MIGTEPVHVPVEAKRLEPVVSLPLMDGRIVFVGAVPASSDEGSEITVVEPKVFVAVTTTRSLPPRNCATI